jgi:nucleotide-binding universal stress UspA family protein
MIKDVMVRLDGSAADELRLAAVKGIADVFHSQVIVLFLNLLPSLAAVNEVGVGAITTAELMRRAREAGDRIEAELFQRLARLQTPVEMRRFDVFSDAMADIAVRQARAVDTFVALRPNGAPEEPERLIEGVLFGSGRSLFLMPGRKPAPVRFDHVLVAWNGSRESARALAEAMPYLHKAHKVTVLAVIDDAEVEATAKLGVDAVSHLKRHGIEAVLHHAKSRDGEVAATLIANTKERKADLLVMGGYGHSRLREWLLGGVTYVLLHHAPVPLLIAH